MLHSCQDQDRPFSTLDRFERSAPQAAASRPVARINSADGSPIRLSSSSYARRGCSCRSHSNASTCRGDRAELALAIDEHSVPLEHVAPLTPAGGRA